MPNLRGLKGTLRIIKWFADGVTWFRPLKFKPADKQSKKEEIQPEEPMSRCKMCLGQSGRELCVGKRSGVVS